MNFRTRDRKQNQQNSRTLSVISIETTKVIPSSNMKVIKSAIVAIAMLSSVECFSMNGIPGSRRALFSLQKKSTVVSMVGTNDEVAALRAAAQKARDEAQRLAKVGRNI